MKILNFVIIYTFGFTATLHAQAAIQQECTYKDQMDAGYVFIEPEEMNELNSRPLDLLADARTQYRNNQTQQAAVDIHIAAELIKIQASGKLKGSHLQETAHRLESLSQRVAKNEIITLATFDYELTQAARDEAEHHSLHAAESWTRHMTRNVGADLIAAVHATEQAADWSGQKISSGSEKVLAASKTLSQKIVAGGKWTADEVGKGIASLGTEINRLGKKIEPTEQRVK